MPWLMKLAVMLRRCRGPRLRDLEKRITKLERSLASSSSPIRRKPVLENENRQAEVQELLAQGNSQSEVARRIGVSRQYISQLVHKGL